jgi:predicted double-glycine peptidase
MASVHYTFQKSNPIPHLVIINGIENEKVYYNDPAEKNGGGSISVTQFQSAWKKRYIEFRLL